MKDLRVITWGYHLGSADVALEPNNIAGYGEALLSDIEKLRREVLFHLC